MFDQIEDIKAIGERLRTQDNRATSHPLFVVQQRRRIYGIHPNWTDDTCWLNEGEVGADEAAKLEVEWRESRLEPEGYTRTGYIDTWVFVTACLTEGGAKDYIRLNGHNLREPRIYADSAYRNREMIALRGFLAALAGEQLDPEDFPEARKS